MENGLIIRQISAHMIESVIEDIPRGIASPYCRLQDGDTITWLHKVDNDIQLVYPHSILGELEAEFKETYGVMHEQLRLF